jgi:hemolysin III
MTTSDRPLLRGRSHQFAFFIAAGAGLALVAMSRTAKIAGVVAVYAASLAAMLGISAAYHRGAWGPRARALWRRADHATIFLFVAGTYTPICLLAVGGTRPAPRSTHSSDRIRRRACSDTTRCSTRS